MRQDKRAHLQNTNVVFIYTHKIISGKKPILLVKFWFKMITYHQFFKNINNVQHQLLFLQCHYIKVTIIVKLLLTIAKPEC